MGPALQFLIKDYGALPSCTVSNTWKARTFNSLQDDCPVGGLSLTLDPLFVIPSFAACCRFFSSCHDPQVTGTSIVYSVLE